MSNADLIAEARGHVCELHGFSTRGSQVLDEMADALEAAEARIAELEGERAARQPAEDDRDFELEAVLREGSSRAAAPDAATEALERIRQAVSGHPECDRYEEGDVISCGWKSAYASVVAALEGEHE